MDFSSYLDTFLIGRNAVGCSEDAIKALQDRYHVMLPDDYVLFLRKAGMGADGLWVGSDYRYIAQYPTKTITLFDLQESGRELLEAHGLSLPPASFVFHMHQGYQFFVLTSDGVYYYLEGGSHLEKVFASFAEFFIATARTF